MEIIGTLPQSSERDEKELDLRTPLGMAWVALRGWAAPEVWTNLHPALGLAKSLNRHDALLTIYHGLWNSVLFQGRIAESLDWVNDRCEIRSPNTTGHHCGDERSPEFLDTLSRFHDERYAAREKVILAR